VDINPYRPPTAVEAYQPPPPGGLEHHYVDQAGRVRTLGILLVAGVLVSAVAIGSGWLELELLERAQRGTVTLEEAEANDSRQQLVAITEVVVHLVTIVVFAMFLVRANKNARALSDMPLEVTPSWMVWWFFIPFANLFKPYGAVREVWERSKGAAPALLLLWWVAWVASGVLGQIALRMTDPEGSIPELMSADRMTIASEVAGIASGLLALWMVTSLHAGQHRHHQTGRPDVPGF
jgi:hypothetical protein